MQMYNGTYSGNRQTYAAMAYALDEGVKNVTDSLKDVGMWNDTVLVFSSGNVIIMLRGHNWVYFVHRP